MKKAFKQLIPVFIAACVLASPITAYAEPGETETQPAQVETAAPPSAVEQVEALIAALDPAAADEAAVSAARAAYDALTSAQKLHVSNFDRLLEAEEALNTPSEENTEEADSETQKSGTKYSFYINDYAPQVSLSIRYQTDDDGDGRMEEPQITITAPDGTVYAPTSDDDLITGEGLQIDILRSSAYTQLDVSEAPQGVWTVRTSNQVLFVLSGLSGETPAAFNENEEGQALPDDNPQEAPAGPNIFGIVKLVVFVAIVVAVFVFLKKGPLFNSGNTESPKKGKSKPAAASPVVKQPHSTDDEEIRKIKQEWEAMKEQYRDDPEDEAPEPPKPVHEDERLYVTQEDIDNDDSIEPLAPHEDDGFFESRF